MWEKKFVYVLNYLQIFKAVEKNNTRTHPLQQNKNAVLTTAAYFKVSTPVMSQGTITVLRLASFTKKGISSLKQKKWTAPLNFVYSN